MRLIIHFSVYEEAAIVVQELLIFFFFLWCIWLLLSRILSSYEWICNFKEIYIMLVICELWRIEGLLYKEIHHAQLCTELSRLFCFTNRENDQCFT